MALPVSFKHSGSDWFPPIRNRWEFDKALSENRNCLYKAEPATISRSRIEQNGRKPFPELRFCRRLPGPPQCPATNTYQIAPGDLWLADRVAGIRAGRTLQNGCNHLARS
jgi:hypothetical protein